MIDEVASDVALTRYAIPRCLHLPIAAVDETAIEKFVGEIVRPLSGAGSRRALLVRAHSPLVPDSSYPIWDHPEAGILGESLQVWVHVGYTRYRPAYRRAFPDQQLDELVLSHAMNRRVAQLRGFAFVRLTPTSRRANSSSAFAEGWGVALHSTPHQTAANLRLGASVAYADVTALMLMLDMNLGGGVMDAVNEGLSLVRPRTVTAS